MNFVPRSLATLNNSKMSLSRSPIWTHCSGRASNRVDCRIFSNHLKLSLSSIGILVGLTFRFRALHPLNSFRVHISTASESRILKRVMQGWVIGRMPSRFFSKKNGITEPRLPMTLP